MSQIEKLRKQLNLSQSQVANAVGVTQPTIQRLEKGKSLPGPDTLDLIAQVLADQAAAQIQALQPLLDIDADTLVKLHNRAKNKPGKKAAGKKKASAKKKARSKKKASKKKAAKKKRAVSRRKYV